MPERLARAADIEQIAEITNREIREGVAHFSTEPLATAEYDADWREHRSRYPWLVATDAAGARVLGYAKAYPWKPRGAYAWTVEIGVYIRPENQGQGLGACLYSHLFSILRAQRYHTAIAGIALPNDPSVRLHERFEMKPVGVFRHVGFKFDDWRDVGYWVRHLAPASAPKPIIPVDQAVRALGMNPESHLILP